ALQLTALLAAMPLQAQTGTGRIVGRVVDAQTGAGVANVTIEVGGTTLGALSGVDGRYVISAVPGGTVTLRAQSIGYAAKTVTDVRVVAGGVVEQVLTL